MRKSINLSAPIRVVPRGDGGKCLVIDYCAPNKDVTNKLLTAKVIKGSQSSWQHPSDLPLKVMKENVLSLTIAH